MNVKIKYVKDKGELVNERIVFAIEANINIGEYALFDTTYKGNGIVSNKLRHAYWFPDKEVNVGDLIVVYTKSGKTNKKLNKDGSYSHFFYWGLQSTIWNEETDCAVVINIADWSYKNV